jgi:hypothetical protein
MEAEVLQVRLCCLLARECAAGNLAVSPGRLRSSLLQALQVSTLLMTPAMAHHALQWFWQTGLGSMSSGIILIVSPCESFRHL